MVEGRFGGETGSSKRNRPQGLLEVTITFLEMTTAPSLPEILPPPNLKLALFRADRCTVSFYRYLYDAVGRPWIWVERKRMSDHQLAAIVQNDQVEIYVLYVGGVPAGYSELDFRRLPEVDLSYFGIMPEFIGLGLGPYLLRWTIAEAWRRGPDRLTVNTCTLDHPAALPLYQRLGFRAYDRRRTMVDPRV